MMTTRDRRAFQQQFLWALAPREAFARSFATAEDFRRHGSTLQAGISPVPHVALYAVAHDHLGGSLPFLSLGEPWPLVRDFPGIIYAIPVEPH